MGYLNTGNYGTSLKEILSQYNNTDFDVIECRCLWTDMNGSPQDNLFGYCQYKDGKLIPLDGDSYSLNDLYIKWETNIIDRENWLTVWEDGYLTDSW